MKFFDLLRFTLLLAVMSFCVGSLWAQSDFSTTYTSNVTLPSTKTCTVIVGGTAYPGQNVGTSTYSETSSITFPKGTKYIHLHVSSWNKENAQLQVKSGSTVITTIPLTANSGMNNSSPFTFNGDPSTDEYYKVITFKNPLSKDMQLEFTTSAKPYRFVLFGVNAEQTPTSVNVQLSSAGLATFASNFALDFSSVTGLEAYTATAEGNGFTLTKQTRIPRGEGMLLRATDNGTEFEVPVATGEVAAISNNALKRGTGAAVTSEADGKYNYILNVVNNKLGFYRAANQTVAKNRAYLQTSTSAARLDISFGDDVSGIRELFSAQGAESHEAYDLQGRRVQQMQKGLYIVNGKKVFNNK